MNIVTHVRVFQCINRKMGDLLPPWGWEIIYRGVLITKQNLLTKKLAIISLKKWVRRYMPNYSLYSIIEDPVRDYKGNDFYEPPGSHWYDDGFDNIDDSIDECEEAGLQ